MPKIAPHFRLDVIEMTPGVVAKSLLVTSEYDNNYYRIYPVSELGEIILSEINGYADTTQIIQKITTASRYKHEDIAKLLKVFSGAGIVISGEYGMPDGQAALWLCSGFTPALVENSLGRMRIAVINQAESPVYQRELSAMLNNFGVNLAQENAGNIDLTVVVVDDYLQESLKEANRRYLKKKTGWLPVKLNGNVHWAGPVFNHVGRDSTDSGGILAKPQMAKNFCWNCLAERMAHGRQIEQAKYRQTGNLPPAPSEMNSPALQASAYNITLEIAKHLLHAEQAAASQFCSSLWVWDRVADQSGWHVVNKDPACVVCGKPPSGDLPPICLDDAEIGSRYVSSGWRTDSPARTFENYRHLNNPYTGVVDSLEDVQNRGDDFCFVFESSTNIATKSDTIFFSLMSIGMRNAGKGTTPATARTGALCEAIERYSTSLHGTEIRKRARYRDFPAGQALMPNLFMNFSDKQFAQNREDNREAAGNPFVNIPNPLSEDEYCEWSPIWSFTHRRPVWTPSQSLYYGYPYAGQWIAVPDTNGVAAGNTQTEAFVQAFLEVLERDAIGIWWYNRLQCSELALNSVDIPFVRGVVEQYERQNRRCWALDISFDLGVNIFVFMSRKNYSTAGGEEAGGEEICLGCAAHFDPEIALTRAICEHGQLWAMIEIRREKTFFKELSPSFSAWLQNASTASRSLKYLLPSGKKQWIDYPQDLEFNLPEQRRACLDMVEEKGWDLYLADYTRPSVGLPVIRVMIPALRSMHRRLGPGRLYDVPVELGLSGKAKTEGEMNKIDIFV